MPIFLSHLSPSTGSADHCQICGPKQKSSCPAVNFQAISLSAYLGSENTPRVIFGTTIPGHTRHSIMSFRVTSVRHEKWPVGRLLLDHRDGTYEDEYLVKWEPSWMPASSITSVGEQPPTQTKTSKKVSFRQQKCTQYQIRYTCGHSLNSEFVKCNRHKDPDVRCPGVIYEEEKRSPHNCRQCNRSG